MELTPGESFYGDVVEKVLGRGGMGITYLLRRPSGEALVLKTLLPDQYGADAIAAAYRELTVLLRMPPHPNVARIQTAALDGYMPHILMDYVPGGDLWTFVHEHGRLSVPECWWVLMNMIEGMGFVSSMCGLVHRDLKPQNLLIDADGFIRVADFGLAKSTGQPFSATPATAGAGAVAQTSAAGTPQFMAPEQVRGDAVLDARTDIWAIGVCMYWLATGVMPFQGATVREVGDAILSHRPPSPAALNPDVDEHLDAIVTRCIEKEPAHRYQDFRELGDDALFGALVKQSPSPLFALTQQPFTGPKISERVGELLVTAGQAAGVMPAAPPETGRLAELAPDGSDWLSYTQRIQTLLNVLNLPEAERMIAAALAHDPDEPIVLTQHAELLARQGRNDEAAAAFDRVLGHEDPKGRRIPALAYAEAIINALVMADYERAHDVRQIAEVRLATETDPDYRKHFESTVRPACQRLDEEEARYGGAGEERAARVRARAQRTCLLAIKHVNAGLREPALHLFRMAVASDPDYGYAWADLGACLMELERYDEAYETLERATRMLPDDGLTWLHRGRVAFKLGRSAEALGYFEQARRLGHPKAQEWIEYCRSAPGASSDKRSWWRRLTGR